MYSKHLLGFVFLEEGLQNTFVIGFFRTTYKKCPSPYPLIENYLIFCPCFPLFFSLRFTNIRNIQIYFIVNTFHWNEEGLADVTKEPKNKGVGKNSVKTSTPIGMAKVLEFV